MLVKDILQKLDLGNSVAEHDGALERYFVETSTFRALVRDEGDIIAGDKGTGKTALFRILKRRYGTLEELSDVEIVEAFNPSGNPVFQRLAEAETLEEGQYITIWKAYVLALVGNWILQIYEEAFTDSMYELDELLSRMGLRSADDSPNTIFSQLLNLVRRFTKPKAIEMAITLTPDGFPIVAPRMELGDDSPPEIETVPHDYALGLLNRVLGEIELSAWVVLDRLDEAFQGFPQAEVPALRALLRTYLDLNEFPRLRLKLFLRRDLFRRIIGDGFVNLTHINARKIEIVWEEEDLLDLLYRRVQENPGFLADIDAPDGDREGTFAAIFPEQVDLGKNRPTTWNWMMTRIRDGNDVRPPRNLIDLVKKAQADQLRREERDSRDYQAGESIITSDALKRGLSRLSSERVEDTLLAEAGAEYSEWIEHFRDGRAEHNEETISKTLGLEGGQTARAVRVLRELGFVEQVGATYKVPMLYRSGLNITQGKAFAAVDDAEDDEAADED
jgi:hypothetical protein